MKIFRCSQIKEIDAYTISHEPILSVDLMERAATRILQWVVSHFPYAKRFVVFAGPGNNGGDGVALARMLAQIGFDVNLYILKSKNYSPDLQENIDRVVRQGIVVPNFIVDAADLPAIQPDSIVIDALFGSGLARPLEGVVATLVGHINQSKAIVVAVDIPSGLYGEDNPHPNANPTVKATYTVTLQFPKLSFIFPENEQFVGQWSIVNIGLHEQAIAHEHTPFTYVDTPFVKGLLRSRRVFSHKGTYGHAHIIAGSTGMMGASVLCVNACLRVGAGLVTAHVPTNGYSIIQHQAPEAIAHIDSHTDYFSQTPDFTKYSCVAVGPGIGQSDITVDAFKQLVKECTVPLVIDADGLNILSKNKELLGKLPSHTILTPHVGEFNRLFGAISSGNERLNLAIEMAAKYNSIIILKGAFTQVVCPSGDVYINSTGNPGMATGGSGDVLTGIIAGLLAQRYTPAQAGIVGVYIHGLAADIAVRKVGQASMVPSDLISSLGEVFIRLEQ